MHFRREKLTERVLDKLWLERRARAAQMSMLNPHISKLSSTLSKLGSTLTAQAFSKFTKAEISELLKQARTAVTTDVQGSWRGNLWRAVGSVVEMLVNLSAQSPKRRASVDPSEDLLYSALDVLVVFVMQDEDARRRVFVFKSVAGSLAKMAVRQAAHDVHACEIAMQLFAQLFKGSDASRKKTRDLFFDEDGSVEMRAMLGNMPSVKTNRS